MTDEDHKTLLQRIADLELELKRERARCARATDSAINLRKMLRLIPTEDQNIPNEARND